MMVWKECTSLFYFDRAATDSEWPLVNDRFGSETVGLEQISVLIIV